MLPNALRSYTRNLTTRIPFVVQAPSFKSTRRYNYDSQKRPWMHTIDSIFSPWSDEFCKGICWASAIWAPFSAGIFYYTFSGRYDLWLHMDNTLRQTVRAELRNVRVIFEDQAQWKQEEERDLMMREVNQYGMPLELNHIRARMSVSDAVALVLAKLKEMESQT